MEESKWEGKHYAFFQNKECEYFPCHKGIEETRFNCLFCYCPLYMLGEECGGNFRYTEKGTKDCSKCCVPHNPGNYGEITGKYVRIAEVMQQQALLTGKSGVTRKNQKVLRNGITTGTCSAAAAIAASSHLLLGMEKSVIFVEIPKGISLEVEVHLVEITEYACEYMVIKDSGDDPDVTNGIEIHVRVERINEKEKSGKGASCQKHPDVMDSYFRDSQYPNLYIDGGVGIGRVTKEGLEQRVGQAAINLVPRQMIFRGVGEIVELAEFEGELLITVFVPEGEELAKRTFNGKLGIEGGISILGTSGIIEPMSERAIVDTIEIEIKQLAAQGLRNLLVTPGNYGQEYASGYLGLDLSNSVKSSNYIGETIDLAVLYKMENFLLVGNLGKLVKLAAGIMNTHSRVADGRGEIMAVHTVLCGGTKEMARRIMECVNTDQMLTHLEEWGLMEAVIDSLCEKIDYYMDYRIGGKMKYGVVLFSEKYGYLGQTKGTEEILYHWNKRGK